MPDKEELIICALPFTSLYRDLKRSSLVLREVYRINAERAMEIMRI